MLLGTVKGWYVLDGDGSSHLIYSHNNYIVVIDCIVTYILCVAHYIASTYQY